ncbi:MAG: hypothetical protein ACRDWH_10035 [Acidimicrobiia bacterium]
MADRSSRPVPVVLMVLLVLEGLGALLVALLNIVTSRALGHDFLPWESTFIPGGFGILCLVAAAGLFGSGTWARILAAIAQLLVLAGGIVGLIYSGQLVLWVGVALGVIGLLLVGRRTVRTA